MTTYELPPEPPVGTRVTDKYGDTWCREDHDWTCDRGFSVWGALVTNHGPLTEAPTPAPAPALPTEPGSVIRATGVDGGVPFKDVVLLLDYEGYWQGVTTTLSPTYHADDRIDTFTVLDTHDPATQAVVPRAALDALRDAFTCKPGNDEDFVSDQAAIDFINATDALNEGNQS